MEFAFCLRACACRARRAEIARRKRAPGNRAWRRYSEIIGAGELVSCRQRHRRRHLIANNLRYGLRLQFVAAPASLSAAFLRPFAAIYLLAPRRFARRYCRRYAQPGITYG